MYGLLLRLLVLRLVLRLLMQRLLLLLLLPLRGHRDECDRFQFPSSASWRSSR